MHRRNLLRITGIGRLRHVVPDLLERNRCGASIQEADLGSLVWAEIGAARPSRKRPSARSSGPNSISVMTEVTGITPQGSSGAPRRWLRKLLLPALKRPKIAMLRVSARANARQLSRKYRRSAIW